MKVVVRFGQLGKIQLSELVFYMIVNVKTVIGSIAIAVLFFCLSDEGLFESDGTLPEPSDPDVGSHQRVPDQREGVLPPRANVQRRTGDLDVGAPFDHPTGGRLCVAQHFDDLVASLTERWGTRYTSTGKTIWAEQPLPDAEDDLV